MVGPPPGEWKVLRDTDGERFVVNKKGCAFQGEFALDEKENQRKKLFLTIKTLLDVIIYPLAVELFASRKDRCAATNKMNLRLKNDGPSKIGFGVAKNFSITIMRLPRWKRRLPEVKALKSDLMS